MQTLLSASAQYRAQNASETITKAAAECAASGSGTPAEATKHCAEDPAETALLSTRPPREMTGHQHDQDRQHLLQKLGRQAAALRRVVGDLTTAVLRPEDTAEDLITAIDLRRLGSNNILSKFYAAECVDVGVQIRRVISHAAENRGKQRFGSAPGLLGGHSQLACKRFDATSWQKIIEVHRGFLGVMNTNGH